MTRRIHTMIAFACLLGLVMGLAACGGDDGDEDSGGSDPVRVATITSGSNTDAGFGETWYAGLQAAQRSAGDRADISWTDGLNSLDALDRGAAAALTEGTDYLFISTSEAPQIVTEYAERFPDTFICDIEAPRKSYPDNVCTILPRFQEGAFLAGVAAGLTTKTDRVGAVAAFDIPIQNLQVEAFALGARYANPDVRVSRPLTESFIDAGKGRAAADALYGSGVDVVLSALAEGTKGIFPAARASDGLVIPQYVDQYQDAPQVVLTSVLYRLDRISRTMIETAVNGKLQAKSYDFGLRELGVGDLAPFRGATGERMTQEARDRLAQVKKDLERGDLVLPELEVLSTRNSGDEVDISSLKGAAG